MHSSRGRHITLIGMPTCGKTKVGKKLAEHLNLRFVDIDDEIVAAYRAPSLQHVVNATSPEEFRNLEEETAIRVAKSLKHRTVIATGGSMVYCERAMQALKERSLIVHLFASLETVERRIARKPDRGIVFAPGETIKDLYARRMPLYDKWAAQAICTDGKRSLVAKELAKVL